VFEGVFDGSGFPLGGGPAGDVAVSGTPGFLFETLIELLVSRFEASGVGSFIRSFDVFPFFLDPELKVAGGIIVFVLFPAAAFVVFLPVITGFFLFPVLTVSGSPFTSFELFMAEFLVGQTFAGLGFDPAFTVARLPEFLGESSLDFVLVPVGLVAFQILQFALFDGFPFLGVLGDGDNDFLHRFLSVVLMFVENFLGEVESLHVGSLMVSVLFVVTWFSMFVGMFLVTMLMFSGVLMLLSETSNLLLEGGFFLLDLGSQGLFANVVFLLQRGREFFLGVGELFLGVQQFLLVGAEFGEVDFRLLQGLFDVVVGVIIHLFGFVQKKKAAFKKKVRSFRKKHQHTRKHQHGHKKHSHKHRKPRHHKKHRHHKRPNMKRFHFTKKVFHKHQHHAKKSMKKVVITIPKNTQKWKPIKKGELKDLKGDESNWDQNEVKRGFSQKFWKSSHGEGWVETKTGESLTNKKFCHKQFKTGKWRTADR
jgi:hypothetical protein